MMFDCVFHSTGKIKTCNTHKIFCKKFKLYSVLRCIYDNILQLHPHAVNLWVDAASFDIFTSGGDENIEGDRVLIQRAIRQNLQSMDLWLQCFALNLHFWMKLVGSTIVLKLEPQAYLSMPAKIVQKIPDSVGFRLEFLKFLISFCLTP